MFVHVRLYVLMHVLLIRCMLSYVMLDICLYVHRLRTKPTTGLQRRHLQCSHPAARENHLARLNHVCFHVRGLWSTLGKAIAATPAMVFVRSDRQHYDLAQSVPFGTFAVGLRVPCCSRLAQLARRLAHQVHLQS
jgi:hypothetical protein